MNWYEKLNTYFPANEMKSKTQLDVLLTEMGDIYHKDEGCDHVMMYAEFDYFIFVDFLLVSEKTRGKGTGHQLIEKLKMKNKPIILEIEPVAEEDKDTEKRLRFYKREGFQHASTIDYRYQAFVVHEETQMEILYWSNSDISEETIYENMKKVYEDVHAYKAESLYDVAPKPTSEVVRYEKVMIN